MFTGPPKNLKPVIVLGRLIPLQGNRFDIQKWLAVSASQALVSILLAAVTFQNGFPMRVPINRGRSVTKQPKPGLSQMVRVKREGFLFEKHRLTCLATATSIASFGYICISRLSWAWKAEQTKHPSFLRELC